MRDLAGASIVALALIGAAGSVSAQTYSVTWWTVDGGGATGTTGGAFVLSGTAGQPDASGGHTGGTYSLAGGFWPASLGSGGPRADLSVSLSDAPDPVIGQQPLTYTIAVANAGPDAASTVAVSDPLPPGVSLDTAGGTGWSCGEPGGAVVCTRAALAVGPAPPITVTVNSPLAAGTLTNTVTVSAAETDPVPTNNSDTETTTVVSPQADLAIAVTDGGVEGRYGEPLTYTVVVSNSGPNQGSGTVTDNFPAGLTGVTWSCVPSGGACTSSGSGNISTTVSLDPGGMATVTATGTVVTGTASPMTNTATVAAIPGVIDPNPANNSATEVTPVGPVGFYTVTPCRVADTRNPPGPSGGPFLDANSTRTFPVGGRCGVPLDARAVAIIMTVVQQTEVGNLRLYPTGGAVPTASAINFVAGRARANNAILKLGTNGQINVQCDMVPGSTGHTHFLFDVFGYFR